MAAKLAELLEPFGCACPGCARSLEMVRRLRELDEYVGHPTEGSEDPMLGIRITLRCILDGEE
jgi:hypothetical protein